MKWRNAISGTFFHDLKVIEMNLSPYCSPYPSLHTDQNENIDAKKENANTDAKKGVNQPLLINIDFCN